MPIEDLRNVIRMPRLGKIHLGVKVEKPGKNPYPQATDYFVCPPEVQEVFGEKPKRLDIMFPTEDPEQFAQQWYRCYSMTQGLVCIGDGVTARRKIDIDTGALASRETREWEWKENLTCNPQDCLEYSTKRCRRVMNLMVLIPRVPGLGVWQIDTSSFYSIVNINSMVELLKNVAGRCCFIPLTLELGPIEVSPPGISKKNVHVLHLKQNLTLAEIARIGLAPGPKALMPVPDVEEAPEDLFPGEVLAEEEEVVAPAEERVIERDVSLIKTENDFNQACFHDFGLQPRPALKMTGYGSRMEVTDWGAAYSQVAGMMGVGVIEPST